MKKRKLFCEISPFTYGVSAMRCRFFRGFKNLKSFQRFASIQPDSTLPVLIYQHKSLIRRTLGEVDPQLQENKAINLSIAAPKVNQTVIKSGEVFSFWHLVGNCTSKKGYQDGLTISSGKATHGVGGGMCQFTNLIHWMVLHTDMDIIEHHHHDQIDLFPDFNRQIPFGTGTSILYNYLDYQFKNNTDITYQIIAYTTNCYLCGEIRADKKQNYVYHISSQGEFFSKESDGVYRNGNVYRKKIDPKTGICLEQKLLRVNHAKVAYDTQQMQLVDSTK